MEIQKELAVFAGGCFWCTEAIFQSLKGVESVISGFCGGFFPNPSYKEVVSKDTGHAEAVQLVFDPTIISYETLLHVFFATHDPTTLNRQGADIGAHYRSAIFFHTPVQERQAKQIIKELQQCVFKRTIVTQIVPVATFYPAESYHQNYYKNHPSQGYCSFVITPKITHLKVNFPELINDVI